MGKINNTQKRMLLKFLSIPGVLINGKLAYVNMNSKTFWIDVTHQLNSVDGGTYKNTWQWCKMWADWKKKTMKKANSILKKNCSLEPPLISYLERKLLKLINYPLGHLWQSDALRLKTVKFNNCSSTTTQAIKQDLDKTQRDNIVLAKRPEEGSDKPEGSSDKIVIARRPGEDSNKPEQSLDHIVLASRPEEDSDKPEQSSDNIVLARRPEEDSNKPEQSLDHIVLARRPEEGSDKPEQSLDHIDLARRPEEGSDKPEQSSDNIVLARRPEEDSNKPEQSLDHIVLARRPEEGSDKPEQSLDHIVLARRPEEGSDKPEQSSDNIVLAKSSEKDSEKQSSQLREEIVVDGGATSQSATPDEPPKVKKRTRLSGAAKKRFRKLVAEAGLTTEQAHVMCRKPWSLIPLENPSSETALFKRREFESEEGSLRAHPKNVPKFSGYASVDRPHTFTENIKQAPAMCCKPWSVIPLENPSSETALFKKRQFESEEESFRGNPKNVPKFSGYASVDGPHTFTENAKHAPVICRKPWSVIPFENPSSETPLFKRRQFESGEESLRGYPKNVPKFSGYAGVDRPHIFTENVKQTPVMCRKSWSVIPVENPSSETALFKRRQFESEEESLRGYPKNVPKLSGYAGVDRPHTFRENVGVTREGIPFSEPIRKEQMSLVHWEPENFVLARRPEEDFDKPEQSWLLREEMLDGGATSKFGTPEEPPKVSKHLRLSGAARRRFRKLVAGAGVATEQAIVMCRKPWSEIPMEKPSSEMASFKRRRSQSDEESPEKIPRKAPSLSGTESAGRPLSFRDVEGVTRVGIWNSEPMSEEQMRLVHRYLILALLAPKQINGITPSFTGFTHKTGWILITCNDQYSQDWLVGEVPKLKPWPQANLTIIPEKIKAVSFIFIPFTEAASVEEAFVLLNRQNKGLNTSEWRILNEKKESRGRLLTVAIDDSSVKYLRTVGFQVHIGFSKIHIKVKGEGVMTPTPAPGPSFVPRTHGAQAHGWKGM